jgi:hypothetical protein
MSEVCKYLFTSLSPSVADVSGNGLDLDDIIVGSGPVLTITGTSPHLRLDCSANNQVVRVARNIGDSGDAFRTALNGAQQLAITWRGRFNASQPEGRLLFGINQWSAAYGDYRLALAIGSSGELLFYWNGDVVPYRDCPLPTDHATVDHTYELQIDSTITDNMRWYVDGVLVLEDNTWIIPSNDTLAIPTSCQIASLGTVFNTSTDNNSSLICGVAAIIAHAGARTTADALDTHNALAADDDTGGSADTTPPTLSDATLTATSDTASNGSVTTDEAGPAWAVATTSATPPSAAQVKAGQDHAGTAAPSDTATLSVGANPAAFSFTGQTTGATYYLHVVQDDEADTPNTSTVETSAGEVIAAPTTITVNTLVFTEGENIRMRMALAAGLRTGGCTLIWREKRIAQTDYSGGDVFSDGTGSWDGGAWTALFVTHGCDGTYDSTGQRSVGASTPMHHEIAGMNSAAFGSAKDYIASNSSLGTQVSYPAQYGVWVERAVTINPNGSVLEHVDYVDFSDPTKVIRQNLATSDPVTPTNQYLDFGAPHWITNGSEDFSGEMTHRKVFSRALTESEIRQELDNFSDTPVVSDCWYSNYSPTASDISDKKPSGTPHPYVWNNGTATDSTAVFDLPAPTEVSATLDLTDATDTVAASATVAISAALSSTDATDTVSSTATAQVVAVANLSDAADTVACAASVLIVSTLSQQDQADTASGSASVAVVAALDVQDQADTLSAEAVIPALGGVQVSADLFDEDDTVAAEATVEPLVPDLFPISLGGPRKSWRMINDLPTWTVTADASLYDENDTVQATAAVANVTKIAKPAVKKTAKPVPVVLMPINATADVLDADDTLTAVAVARWPARSLARAYPTMVRTTAQE